MQVTATAFSLRLRLHNRVPACVITRLHNNSLFSTRADYELLLFIVFPSP